MILRKIYPGVDVRTARSRLIDENRIAAGDVALARSARDAITAARMAEDHPELARVLVVRDRARTLQWLFSQPFYVAEPVTKRLGSHVSREEGAKRGKTNTALSAIDGQRKARAALVDDRNREAGALLASLKAERASVAAQSRRMETEAAPIRYVAELAGPDTDSDRAIRWLILMMVLCCDPLAIALTAAATARR